MGEFQAVLLEGLFFLSEEEPEFRDILVQTPTGVKRVYTTLAPLIGQQVYFAMHHVPSDPINPSRWGGGSCLWQPSWCPFGHHDHPTRLFNLTVQGVLTYAFDPETNSEGWAIDCPDGLQVVLPLASHLAGHTARVAATTILAAEQMHDLSVAEGLGQRVVDLQDLLVDLSRILKRT